MMMMCFDVLLDDVVSADCGPNEWLCVQTQQCIRVDQVCDGVPNCANGADESENCSMQASFALYSSCLNAVVAVYQCFFLGGGRFCQKVNTSSRNTYLNDSNLYRQLS